MVLIRRPTPPSQEDSPEDIFKGECASCKSIVVCIRADLTIPEEKILTKPGMSRKGQLKDYDQTFSEIPYTECVVCKKSSLKGVGGRVYMYLKERVPILTD